MVKQAPCTMCAQPMTVGKSSSDQPICRPCRRIRKAKTTRRCGWCGAPDVDPPRRYCSRVCFARDLGDANRIRDLTDHRSTRRHREQLAAGLTAKQRTELLSRWTEQRRQCSYCPKAATTIDHVIPLIRGGTNFEGNLTPACKRCNSSKAARLVMEWRTDRPASASGYRVDQPQRPEREPKPKFTQLALCADCDCYIKARAKTCRPCAVERQRIEMRNKYRLRVGIPVEAPVHDRSWRGPKPACSEADCERESETKRLCHMHYNRAWQRARSQRRRGAA